MMRRTLLKRALVTAIALLPISMFAHAKGEGGGGNDGGGKGDHEGGGNGHEGHEGHEGRRDHDHDGDDHK